MLIILRILAKSQISYSKGREFERLSKMHTNIFIVLFFTKKTIQKQYNKLTYSICSIVVIGYKTFKGKKRTGQHTICSFRILALWSLNQDRSGYLYNIRTHTSIAKITIKYTRTVYRAVITVICYLYVYVPRPIRYLPRDKFMLFGQ